VRVHLSVPLFLSFLGFLKLHCDGEKIIGVKMVQGLVGPVAQGLEGPVLGKEDKADKWGKVGKLAQQRAEASVGTLAKVALVVASLFGGVWNNIVVEMKCCDRCASHASSCCHF